MDSILDSVKNTLGIELDDDSFDSEVTLHINAALSTLNQLGVGPQTGFAIEDNTATWAELLGDDIRLNDVKQYVYLKTRIVFDPPTSSFQLVQSMKDLIKELEWRINTRREGDSWVDPQPVSSVEPEVIVVPVDQAWYSE